MDICEGCKWKEYPHEGLHCYMFKEKLEFCRKNVKVFGEPIRLGREATQQLIVAVVLLESMKAFAEGVLSDPDCPESLKLMVEATYGIERGE